MNLEERGQTMSSSEFGQILRDWLNTSQKIKIDGLGTFERAEDGQIFFQPDSRPRVFLAYVVEDQKEVLRLYDALRASHVVPWMDIRKLIPGQNWPRAIEDAISVSDYFIPCLSKHSVAKRGDFQAELRYALDCARRQPLDKNFIVPVRLDDCRVPRILQRDIQYVDLFPDREAGFRKLLSAFGEGFVP